MTTARVAALALALALALCACAAERAPTVTGSGGPAPGPGADRTAADGTGAAPVDEALLAYLATARAHHLRADLLEEKGDNAGARAEMEALLAVHGGADPAYLDAAQDAYARLARLDLHAAPPRTDDAMRAVESGLALAPDETFYRANLLLAKGEVLEARGDKDAALDAYEQSIAVNKKVLERLEAEKSR
jgi:tetratricopeptide (TPR) repeat protein